MTIPTLFFSLFIEANHIMVTNRGGVEDTRLEAKAKDTKKSEAKAKGGLSEDRHSRGQGHKRKCSPKKKKKDLHKNFLSDLQKKKKKKRSSQKFFKRSPQKNVFQNIFQALHDILTIQNIVLSSSQGQANFRGLEASRPRPRTSKCVLEDSTSGNKYSKTTKARNLKFGQTISLYMNLRLSNFGGATSRGLGHMHPKFVTAKFIKRF